MKRPSRRSSASSGSYRRVSNGVGVSSSEDGRSAGVLNDDDEESDGLQAGLKNETQRNNKTSDKGNKDSEEGFAKSDKSRKSGKIDEPKKTSENRHQDRKVWFRRFFARDDALELAALVAGRGLVSAGISLVLVASPQLLLEINGGDHASAEHIRALIETVNTVTGLLSRSLIGNFIDSYGRLPALVIGPALSAGARLLVAVYPSNGTYIIYRIVNMFSLIPLMQAFTASLADRLGGRGSDEYAEFNRYAWMLLAIVRMVVLNFARVYRLSLKRSFILAAIANASAALFFYFCVKDTLRPEDRKPFNLRQAANPFSFVGFFKRTRSLQSLACVTLLTSIPLYNGTIDNYRAQQFNWKMKENAQMHQVMNVVEIISSFYSVHIMKHLGRKKTVILRQWMFVLTNLNSALAPDGRWHVLNPILSSLFDEGAFDALVAEAADEVHAGQGELSSAMMNLRFPLGLTLPIFFSRLFARSSNWENPFFKGTVPFWLCAVIHVINATIVLPLCWDGIMGRRRADSGSVKKQS